MNKLHLQHICTDLILFSFLPPNFMFKEGLPWDYQKPHHWQFCPFIKEKQASRGLVFPGLEKWAGPRVGLDFRAWRGRSSGEAGKARRALSLALKVAGPVRWGALVWPGLTGSPFLAEPWGWPNGRPLALCKEQGKPGNQMPRVPTTSGFCKPLMIGWKDNVIRKGTDIGLPIRSGLKGIAFELCNKIYVTSFSPLPAPSSAYLHGAWEKVDGWALSSGERLKIGNIKWSHFQQAAKIINIMKVEAWGRTPLLF